MLVEGEEAGRRIIKSNFSSFLFSSSELGSRTLGAFLTIVFLAVAIRAAGATMATSVFAMKKTSVLVSK